MRLGILHAVSLGAGRNGCLAVLALAANQKTALLPAGAVWREGGMAVAMKGGKLSGSALTSAERMPSCYQKNVNRLALI